ncbi:MAG: hypothetical protein ACKOPQ_03060 [Novosphingobium sp.]
MPRAGDPFVGLRTRLIAVAALAFAVGAGIAGFLIGQAPGTYSALNAAALAVAALLIVLASGAMRKGAETAVILAALALLAASLIFGPDVQGVHRWLAAGPLVVHVGMLVIPSLCVVLNRQPPALAIAAVAALTALIWAQPDAASALAVFCALAAAGLTRRDKGSGALAILALLGLVLTARRPDPLNGLPFVETAIGDAWAAHPLLGLLEIAGLLTAIIAPTAVLARSGRHRLAPALALTGAMSGFAIAGLVGAYPQPLVGYGASAIVGYGLSLALLCMIAER